MTKTKISVTKKKISVDTVQSQRGGGITKYWEDEDDLRIVCLVAKLNWMTDYL